MKRSLLVFSAVLLLSAISVHAQSDTLTYVRKEIMISMRDGVKLNTLIYAPRTNEKLPILFMRTPYGVSHMSSPNKSSYLADMAKDGYIFAFQDIRGRYKSEGKFEMLRFRRDKKDPKSIDESSDTYDAIDWMIKNIPDNNGKVGMYGISYGGWTTMMGTLDPHPALKAASEQASPSDMWMGDDFHHNGAFRLSYGFEYAYMEEATKEDAHFEFGQLDTYEWYLKLGPLSNVNDKYFHGKIPTWNNFVNHPDYDDFWKKQSLPYRLGAPSVPNLHVAGYWDQEDWYGPLKAYEVLEQKDKNNMNFIVIGPWNHGGWGRMGMGDQLGNIKFDQPTGVQFRQQIQAPWFAYHLKGKTEPPKPEAIGFNSQGIGGGGFPEAMTFQTGTNTWKAYKQWPPAGSAPRNLYLAADGKLSWDKPAEPEAADHYISDPARPVPYRARPIEATYGRGSRWNTWLTEDQRFVHNRPDVAAWETEILQEDVTVTGTVMAKLFAATSGTDSDWIVKLIDVYDEGYGESNSDELKMNGYQLMVANEVFRGRYYKSFEKPEALKSGEPNLFTIDLHAVNHVFKKGHKIMVQVQSTWFPIIDRNPQTFVPNIFEAKESDFKSATQTIYRSASMPTHIVLPVIR